MTLNTLSVTAQAVTAQAESVYQESYIYGGHVSAQEGCKLAKQAITRQAVAQQCGSLMRGGSVCFKGKSEVLAYRSDAAMVKPIRP